VSALSEITEEELLALFDLRGQITTALRQAFCAEGFNFAWNEGEVAGQTVPHLHLHIVPRRQGDAGILQYEPRSFLYRPGDRDRENLSELIRARKRVSEFITVA
jgi:histidine triad (HIT) family protein